MPSADVLSIIALNFVPPCPVLLIFYPGDKHDVVIIESIIQEGLLGLRGCKPRESVILEMEDLV